MFVEESKKYYLRIIDFYPKLPTFGEPFCALRSVCCSLSGLTNAEWPQIQVHLIFTIRAHALVKFTHTDSEGRQTKSPHLSVNVLRNKLESSPFQDWMWNCWLIPVICSKVWKAECQSIPLILRLAHCSLTTEDNQFALINIWIHMRLYENWSSSRRSLNLL